MRTALKALLAAGACLVAVSFSAQAARIQRPQATRTTPPRFSLLKTWASAPKGNSKSKSILQVN